VVELTLVTVIVKLVVAIAGKVTVNPTVQTVGRAPKSMTVPSENVSVPDVIWSTPSGRSYSTTLSIV
jgi:Na+-transporting NADH:ubiquinone oxidoreductase subunit NqrB